MDEARKAQIMADLGKYSGAYPLMQEGDYTSRDLIETFGMSAGNSPTEFMKQVVAQDPEIWEMLQVVDRIGARRWFWVLRKKI
jgi:hypothetical protein